MGVLWTLQSSQPGLSFYSALPMAYGTSYYAISLGINIVITLLITIRLLQYRRTVMSVMSPEQASHYLSLATVLVESAALYSVFALLFLITYAVNNPTNQVWLGVAQATQVSYCVCWSEGYPLKHKLSANIDVPDHCPSGGRAGVEQPHDRQHGLDDDTLWGEAGTAQDGERDGWDHAGTVLGGGRVVGVCDGKGQARADGECGEQREHGLSSDTICFPLYLLCCDIMDLHMD